MSSKRPRPIDNVADSKVTQFACKRCRLRKVKCDAELPSCTGCLKSDVPCIVVDPSTTRDYTRAEVHSLEQKLADLESVLGSNDEPNSTLPPTNSNLESQYDTPSARFVGPESGITFIQPVVDAIRKQSRSTWRHQTASRGQDPSLVYHEPHSLPPRETSLLILDEYFREFHLCHPLIERAKTYMIFEEVYSSLEIYTSSSRSLSKKQKQNLFQAYMVLAIGNIRPFRDGIVSMHPFGFFTAALEVNPPSESAFNAVEDLQNLLLIAHFGVYYDIGCSIWELGRLCIRICIELQLHRRRPNLHAGCSPDAQNHCRVFWECYLLDRFSSSVLSRPYGIDDVAIDVDLPAEGPEATVSNHLIRLGQITSAMHYSLYNLKPASHESTNPVEIFSQLRSFTVDLKQWRRSAPTFAAPTCVYETSEYYDLSFQDARLWLLRATINKLPAEWLRVRAKLLLLCLEVAQAIVHSFQILKQRNLITYNRAFARLILISGLITVSVMKTLSTNRFGSEDASKDSEVDIDFWIADLGESASPHAPSPAGCLETLGIASQILSWFAKNMPDVSPYVQFFDFLKTELEKLDMFAGTETAEDNVAFQHNTLAQPLALYSMEFSRRAEAPGITLPQQTDGTQYTADSRSGELELSNQHTINDSTMDLHWEAFYNDNVSRNNDHQEPVGFENGWPLMDAPWMEEIDYNLSGSIWDTITPWLGSPATSFESNLM